MLSIDIAEFNSIFLNFLFHKTTLKPQQRDLVQNKRAFSGVKMFYFAESHIKPTVSKVAAVLVNFIEKKKPCRNLGYNGLVRTVLQMFENYILSLYRGLPCF